METATKLGRAEKQRGDEFDFVYCVFDRDTHPSFDEASNVAQGRGIKLARSWPCFEFWLLLHFGYSRKSYMPHGRRSACEDCIRDLRQHIPNYSKGDAAYFDDLWDRVDAAIANAERTRADAEHTSEPNPSTEVHELVAHLQRQSGRGRVAANGRVSARP